MYFRKAAEKGLTESRYMIALSYFLKVMAKFRIGAWVYGIQGNSD